MDRAGAVRERIDAAKSLALKARNAGPPCSDCRYRTLLRNCGNPAYAEPHFEASSGVYDEMFQTPVTKARADDGLCGPEALLFEARPPVVEVAKGVGTGLRTVMAYVTGGIIVIGLAAQLLSG